MYYEVSYYIDANLNNPESIGFSTRKKALEYYTKHKNEYYDWWIVKKDNDDNVIEDIII